MDLLKIAQNTTPSHSMIYTTASGVWKSSAISRNSTLALLNRTFPKNPCMLVICPISGPFSFRCVKLRLREGWVGWMLQGCLEAKGIKGRVNRKLLEFDIMCKHAQCAVCAHRFLFGNIIIIVSILCCIFYAPMLLCLPTSYISSYFMFVPLSVCLPFPLRSNRINDRRLVLLISTKTMSGVRWRNGTPALFIGVVGKELKLNKLKLMVREHAQPEL
jgi:hypothetical protein